jgi:hypothetical protein
VIRNLMWWMVELSNLCQRMMLMADPGGRSFVGIAGTNPARAWVSCECCVLSGRGLFVGLITRPEESY